MLPPECTLETMLFTISILKTVKSIDTSDSRLETNLILVPNKRNNLLYLIPQGMSDSRCK